MAAVLAGPASESGRPYRTVRELIHTHYGQPAVVLGGGPSLPEQLARCPARGEAVYLSANQHGAVLTECDYLVCHDKRDSDGNPMEQTLRALGAPIVSRHMFADFRIMGSIVPSTGVETAWVARLLGCAPIYICGMDCFGPGGTYHHDPRAKSNGFEIPLELHLKRWRETLEKYPADYRALGGPLAEHLPQWQCVAAGPVARERLEHDAGGVFVRLLQRAEVRGRTFPAGSTVELPPREAERLVKGGKAQCA